MDDIRVRGVGKSCVSEKTSLQKSSDPAKELSVNRFKFFCWCGKNLIYFLQVSSCYFKGGSKKTNVYRLKDLLAGHTVNGPAIIIEPNRFGWKFSTISLKQTSAVFVTLFSTVVVEPDCTAVITDEGNVRIDVLYLH